MEFKEIVSITGMPGLYHLQATKNNGVIVKSLDDGKSQFISSRAQTLSSLDNVSVFMKDEETAPLKNILIEMKKQEAETPVPDPKEDEKKLKEYFKKITPDFNEEKVHYSDMKKMLRWYQSLKQHDLIPKEEEKPTTEGAEEKAPGETSESKPENA